jgi:hypothetical protein
MNMEFAIKVFLVSLVMAFVGAFFGTEGVALVFVGIAMWEFITHKWGSR